MYAIRSYYDPVYCALYGLKYREISLDNNMLINLDDYSGESAGIIFPNPNAPTGEYIEPSDIETLLAKNMDRVVIVDEAYIEFGGESAAKFIDKYPNLLIIRTMSKSHSLAGLRLGYAMGQPHLIDGIIRVKNSFNSYTCDTLAQAGATIRITSYNVCYTKLLRARSGDAMMKSTIVKIVNTFIWFTSYSKDTSQSSQKCHRRYKKD